MLCKKKKCCVLQENVVSKQRISKSQYSHQDAPPGRPYITMGQQNACRVWSWRAGAESIHAKFNSLLSQYNTMHDKVQKLLCIVKQHFLPPHLTYHHQKRESSNFISFHLYTVYEYTREKCHCLVTHNFPRIIVLDFRKREKGTLRT